MRRRRDAGLTLVELLASLVLLGAMAVAAAGWMGLAARAQTDVPPRLARQLAARHVLEMIALDIAVDDFTPRRAAAAEEARVLTGGDRVTVRTRAPSAGGPASVRRTYMLEGDRLVLSEGGAAVRVLVPAGVEGFSVQEGASAGRLVVRIRLDGKDHERTYVLP